MRRQRQHVAAQQHIVWFIPAIFSFWGFGTRIGNKYNYFFEKIRLLPLFFERKGENRPAPDPPLGNPGCKSLTAFPGLRLIPLQRNVADGQPAADDLQDHAGNSDPEILGRQEEVAFQDPLA